MSSCGIMLSCGHHTVKIVVMWSPYWLKCCHVITMLSCGHHKGRLGAKWSPCCHVTTIQVRMLSCLHHTFTNVVTWSPVLMMEDTEERGCATNALDTICTAVKKKFVFYIARNQKNKYMYFTLCLLCATLMSVTEHLPGRPVRGCSNTGQTSTK